jgi:hypothetical protein
MQQSLSADNQQPSAVELAWLAGIIDGEGNLGLNVLFRKGRNRLQVAPRMTIVNTSEIMVRKIDDILNAMPVGHHIKNRPMHSKAHAQCYEIHINGYKRIASILPRVIPYLVAKKLNAVNYRLANWKQANGGRGSGYDGVELEVHQALKALNHNHCEGSETMYAASRLIEKMI